MALMYPLRIGDSAAAAQQELLRGMTNAMLTVLHMLPPKDGSRSPTAAQVLQALMHGCKLVATQHATPVLA